MPWAMSWCAVVPGARLRRTGGVCIGVAPWARCSSRAGIGLLAFAVRAGTQPVRVPGAPLVRAPLHLAAVDRTPARVGVLGGLHLRGAGRWGVVGLRLQGGRDGRGDLLVQRPGLGLALLLGLLAAALGLLLAGGEVGFAAVQDLLEPGQAHGGPALQL